jgi:hypothetical protein
MASVAPDFPGLFYFFRNLESLGEITAVQYG